MRRGVGRGSHLRSLNILGLDTGKDGTGSTGSCYYDLHHLVCHHIRRQGVSKWVTINMHHYVVMSRYVTLCYTIRYSIYELYLPLVLSVRRKGSYYILCHSFWLSIYSIMLFSTIYETSLFFYYDTLESHSSRIGTDPTNLRQTQELMFRISTIHLPISSLFIKSPFLCRTYFWDAASFCLAQCPRFFRCHLTLLLMPSFLSTVSLQTRRV